VLPEKQPAEIKKPRQYYQQYGQNDGKLNRCGPFLAATPPQQLAQPDKHAYAPPFGVKLAAANDSLSVTYGLLDAGQAITGPRITGL
jgi:hypothetical protein